MFSLPVWAGYAGIPSIILVGHPRLRHVLKQSEETQEIGDRAFFHEMRGIAGREREFFEWMMKQCLMELLFQGLKELVLVNQKIILLELSTK